MQAKYIAALIFSVFVVIFTLQNVNTISIQLMMWEVKISIALMVIVIFVLGGFSAIIFSSAKLFKKSKQIRELETEIKNLKNKIFEKELAASKNQTSIQDNPRPSIENAKSDDSNDREI